MSKRISIVHEENSFFVLPTIRISSERNVITGGYYYLYIDFSWLNKSVSIQLKEE